LPFYAISAVTGEGLPALIHAVDERLQQCEREAGLVLEGELPVESGDGD
jgi:hypothetical protein